MKIAWKRNKQAKSFHMGAVPLTRALWFSENLLKFSYGLPLLGMHGCSNFNDHYYDASNDTYLQLSGNPGATLKHWKAKATSENQLLESDLP